jgi:predicted secreted hydrolase
MVKSGSVLAVSGLFLALAFTVMVEAQEGPAGAPEGPRGFAGLGSDAAEFAVPERGGRLVFPEDHGAHPGYRIEWWYLTAALRDAEGRDYGVQFTLFRSALAAEGAVEGWATPQIWMGHAGVTTEDAHYAAERFARGGIGQAGVHAAPFAAWIDNWELAADGPCAADAVAQGAVPGCADALDVLRLRVGMGGDGVPPDMQDGTDPAPRYDLRLQARGPLVLHGEDGFSVKSDSGQASWYYSQPFYAVEGVLHFPDGPVAVTGTGWLDREWSSQPLDPGQEGWDWVALHLDDGARMMGFRLRGTGEPFFYASWISPDGVVTPYGRADFTMEPLRRETVRARAVPVGWRLRLPEQGLDVEIDAVNPQAWMDVSFPYWEGPVRVSGSHAGRGYLEMTGYAVSRGP